MARKRKSRLMRRLYRSGLFPSLTVVLVFLLLLGGRSLKDAVVTALAPAMAGTPTAASASDWEIPARYHGHVIRNAPRHFPERIIALTFDDGPDPRYTPMVLKALAKHEARATFFVLGCKAEKHPELLQQMVAAGHTIGIHSYSHPAYPSEEQAESEIERTRGIIVSATGLEPTLYRPPYGIVRNNLTLHARRMGYPAVLWTINSADTKDITADTIAANVLHAPKAGDIALMHDGPGHLATAEAVPTVLGELRKAGFRFVTVPELIRSWDKFTSTPQPGTAATEK